jgi:hypothetical protein
MGTVMFIYFAIIILLVASMWIIFTKAGKPGWAVLVPVYNIIVWIQISGKPVWWILLFLIPAVDFVFIIWVLNLVVKGFGKSTGFTIGALLLPFIFFPLLAFGDAKYSGPAGK